MRRNKLQTWVAKFIALAIVLAPTLDKVRAQEPSKQTVWPDKTWKVANSPEAAGWSSEKLTAAKAYGDSIHTSAVMIVQGGEIYSSDGVIDINETLEQLGIDDSPDPLTKQEKQARIVDLLRARSGVYHPVDFETPDQKELRPARGKPHPGHILVLQ